MALEHYLAQLSTVLSSIEVNDSSDLKLGLNESLHMILDSVQGKKNKVILIGNGGSAAIASHIAVDLWKNGGVRAMAFNDISLITCVGNDYGFEHIFEKPIEMFADAGDVLIAISSSGSSENIIKGVNAAIDKKCLVVTLSGFAPDNPLRKMGQINFYAPSGAYGFVENAHAAICHCVADVIISKNKVG